MESAPEVIPITDLRRDAARIISRAVASGTPVYVTQHGRVTAVLLPEQSYQGLLHRVAVLEAAGRQHADAADEVRAPVAGRRRLHEPIGYSSALVRTRFGLTDPETAAFLIEEGYGVGTGGVAAGDAGAPGVGAGASATGGFSASWLEVDEDQAG